MTDLRDCRLYGIIDLGYVTAGNAPRVLREMLQGGVDIVQLRAKTQSLQEIAALALELHKITEAAGVPFVINDHPQIARDVAAEGVHVGQDDMSVDEARHIAGAHCFVGKSTHSVAQANAAASDGADYIGFGPLFATPTKPDYTAIGLHDLASVHAQVQLPIFCIGGIKLENLAQVIAAGAERVVIVSGLLQAPDIAKYARAAIELLETRHSVARA